MNSDQLIMYIVKLFTSYLEELSAIPRNDFIHGEMTAYVETLEIIQTYKSNLVKELNYVIEQRYKI